MHVFGTGPLPDRRRGAVPALRLLPGLPPAGRAVDDLPHAGRRRQRPAAGDVHRARRGARRADPGELRAGPARRDARVQRRRDHRRADRDGDRRAPARAARDRGHRGAGGTRRCSTTPTWCSTSAPRPATRWCGSRALDTPVGPGSTIAAVALANELKVRTAELAARAGRPAAGHHQSLPSSGPAVRPSSSTARTPSTRAASRACCEVRFQHGGGGRWVSRAVGGSPRRCSRRPGRRRRRVRQRR